LSKKDIEVPLIPECSSCILNSLQTLLPLIAKNKEEQFELYRLAFKRLSEGYKKKTPPVELSILLYRELYSLKGTENPLSEIKRLSIEAARKALPWVDEQVLSKSGYDRLRAALAAAIAGNLIDYNTANYEPDLGGLRSSFTRIIEEGFAIDDSKQLWESLDSRTGLLTYLADNAGETYLDMPFLRLAKELGWTINFVVKGEAMVNDATEEDVEGSGIEEIAEVSNTGAWALGVPKKWVSHQFLELIARSQLVISKGQANVETFPEIQSDFGVETYYVLKAKCPHIAEALNAKKGDNIVLRRPVDSES